MKPGRELWAFLMSSPEPWPPSPLQEVTAPSLACKLSQQARLEREQDHPIICLELGNRCANALKGVCHLEGHCFGFRFDFFFLNF